MISPLGSTRNLSVAFVFALSVLLVSFAGWRVNASRAAKPADKARQANAQAANPYIEYVLSVQGEPGEASAVSATAARRPAQASPPPNAARLTRAASFEGDLRNLPQKGPVKKERPERHGPRVELRTIGDNVPRDAGRLLPGPNPPAPGPIANFNGLDFASFGAGRPPDTNGDVGPTYFIQSVNSSIGIYRKSDNVRVVGLTLDNFMSQGSFGNLCDSDNFGDPVVLYDSFEDRWVITDFAFQLDGSDNVIFPPGMFQCFAVSKTGDPVAGGWNYYSINTTGGLGDYGKFGIWPDGIYMTVNMFDYAATGGFQNVRVYAFNKAQMYANAAAPQVVSFDLPPDEFTVLPANARLQTGTPPPGTPNLYAVVWNFANVISTYKFHVDWNSISLSTFTGPFDTLAPTSFAVGPDTVPAMGGTANDTLSHRLMMQNQYTNIGGVESLWNSHTVQGTTAAQAAVRWYQVNVTGGAIAANTTQAATHNPDTTNRYMPSLALNRLGDMMIGYSVSSSTLRPAIRYAGRLAADTVNTLPQTETSLIEGAGAQNTSNRWGDYSTMTLDLDGCTFWFTSEYYAVTGGNWQTRIGSFKYPGCTNVTSGTITGTVTASAGGAPLSGAAVALGSRTTTTNGSGGYTFTGIPAGTYSSLTGSAAGFNASAVASLAVSSGGTTTQNFALSAAPTSGCPTDTTQADFQTGAPTSVDLTGSPGNVTLSSIANLDQSHTGGTTTGTSFTATGWTGQTFIPAVTSTLTKVDAQLFCGTCTGTTPNLTVSIRNTSGGLPTGADLASATIAGFSNGAGVFYTANFGAPVALTAGTQYALVLRPVANPSAGNYFWIRALPGAYANGQRVLTSDSGSTWTADSTRDFNFRTYMQAGFVASGNLVSGTKDANPGVSATATWTTLSWTASTPANTTLQFQVAGSNNVNGPFNFVGPNGTAGTFFTTSGASLSQFNGLRYLRYKAYLATTNSAVTPTLNDVALCFNNGANATPTITATGPLARQQASPAGAAVQIATVNDTETPAGNLTVAATTVPTGITVTNIMNAGGTITANVAALCNAALGSNTVVLTVTDGGGAMATANLTVNVSANTPPVLTYNSQVVAAGGALNVNPATGLTDNGTVNTVVVQSQGTYTGTISVNASGVVSLSNAKPGGAHTIMIRATDNCGAPTDASFTLTVNCPTVTVNPASLPNGTVSVGYNQTITASGGTAPYTFSVSAGAPPIGVTLAAGGVLSGTPSAANTFNFTVMATDANGCTGVQAYAVSINTLPTINAVAVNRQQGSPVSNSTSANVNDADQTEDTLTVTVNGGASATVNGVTVSGISVSAAGVVTANVLASCTASTANFTLTVTDNTAATANATLTVTVAANTAPTLAYNNQSVAAGGALNVSPATGPTDNGTIASIVVQSLGTYTGTISVNNSTGVVAISSAAPVGTHTIMIRATDQCGAMTDASFTLTVGNNPPTITAGGTFARQQGSPAGAAVQIATVNDTETPAGNLTVMATTVPPGISVTGITNTGGTITATIAALCNAALGNNTVVLTVTDANSGMATANITVNVTANSLPILGYSSPQNVQAGVALTVTPTAGPSDNGSVATLAVQSQGTYTGTLSVNNSTGVVALSNAAPVGAHTIMIRATDNCGATTDATFTLNVNNNLPTITAGGPLTRQQGSPGSAGSVATIATVNDGETPRASLTVTVMSAPAGISVTSISAPNATTGEVTATVAADCTAATGANTVVLKVTDGNSGMATANLTVNVTANSAPVLTYANQSVATGGALNVSPATGPTDNGTIASIVVQSQGTYTGTISVNNSTGVVSFSNAKPGGVHTLMIRSTDNCGATTDASFTLTVNCPTITVNPASLPNGTTGANYNQTLTASGGAAPYTFATSAGMLPTGLTLSAGGVLSGLPSVVNLFNFTVQATDANGCTGTQAYALTINALNNLPTINAVAVSRQQGSPASNATSANVNDLDQPLNSLAVTVNGGASATVNGVTVSGISVNAAGVVTANVVAACAATAANFTLTVTDAAAATATATLTVTVTANSAPTLTYSNQAVFAGTASNISPASGPGDNGSISSIVVQSQGTYTGTISVNNSTGVVALSNAAPVGVHTPTIRVTDNCGVTTDATVTLTVNNNLPTITAAAPLARQQGSAGTVSTIATVSDTETPAGSLTVAATTVPAGLSVTGITNTNGTITASVAALCSVTLGNNTVVLTVTDGNTGTAPANLTVNVTANSAPVLTYANQAVAAGGALNVSPATGPTDNGTIASIAMQNQGTYTGTVSVNNSSGVVAFSNAKPGGVHTLVVRVTDNCNVTTDATFTLTVNCPAIALSPPSLPNGTAGIGYNQTITASGGTAPYTFSLSTGTLPTGVTLASGGALAGTPTNSGTFDVTVMATDANGCTGTQAYSLVINPACTTITVNPAALANGFVGTAYSQTLTATGGTAPYTFAVTGGSLPNGLTLANGGALTGTPTTPGTFGFTVTATASTGCTGTRAYTVIVSGNGLQFYALSAPVRLLETRVGFSGCTMPGAPINAGGTLTLPARTACAGIPANAAAVTGNITVVPSGPGFLTLFPSSATQPTVANSNFGAGEITNNVFTAGLGAGDGAFKIFSSALTHVIVDVTGYYAPPGTGGLYFHPLATPVRLLETRVGFTGCIAPGVPLTGTGNPNADPNLDLLLQGRSPVAAPCNSIPATAQVLVGNATTVLPAALGYLTIYPSGGTRPTVASSNYAGNDVINGPFAVKLGADGKFKLYTFATTDLVVDILGYYSAEANDANGAGLLFNPLPSPVRLLETRPDLPGFPLTGCTRPNAPIAGNLATAMHTQMAANFCGLPATAQAVVGNVSVVNSTGAGFLTLFPANLTTAPLVTTSNYTAPATFGYNRHYFVGLSPADGKFKVLTQFTTDLILDASGYFAP